jgi:hypothetical protein
MKPVLRYLTAILLKKPFNLTSNTLKHNTHEIRRVLKGTHATRLSLAFVMSMSLLTKSKVKLSPQQALEAYRVVRC